MDSRFHGLRWPYDGASAFLAERLMLAQRNTFLPEP